VKPVLAEALDGLQQRGVQFKSLQEQLDTSICGGKFVFHFIAAVAEFERSLIRERTKPGLAAARARGYEVAAGA
jgi:DNA invertase Pin-like site-specific DNA recombinase